MQEFLYFLKYKEIIWVKDISTFKSAARMYVFLFM